MPYESPPIANTCEASSITITRARSVGWDRIDFGVATSRINSAAAEEYRPVLRSAANQFGLYVVFSHLRSLNFLTSGLFEPFMTRFQNEVRSILQKSDEFESGQMGLK